MPRTVERKEHPISMRMPEADIAMIDRAAARRRRSRTDFDAAVRAAEDVLMETAPIRMSPAGFKAFHGDVVRTGGSRAGNGGTLQARGAMGVSIFKQRGRALTRSWRV